MVGKGGCGAGVVWVETLLMATGEGHGSVRTGGVWVQAGREVGVGYHGGAVWVEVDREGGNEGGEALVETMSGAASRLMISSAN